MKLFFQTLLCLTALTGAHGSYASLAERKQAAIINAAVGDALGRITEFVDTTDKIHAKFGKDGVTCIKQALMKHPQSGVTVAPYTDDTLISIIVLEALLKARTAAPHSQDTWDYLMVELIYQFARLFTDNKYVIDPLFHIRAHGTTISNSLKKAISMMNLPDVDFDIRQTRLLIRVGNERLDTSLWNFEEIKREGGCGSVMRVWPLGLVFSDNIPLLIELADKQSQLTHRHPMARAASVAMAVGTAYALQDKPVDEIIAAMIEAAQKFDAEEKLYKSDELLTSALIKYAYDAARNGVAPDKVLGTHNKMQANKRSTENFLLGWAADEAVAAAVYIFVRHSDNPQQAVIEGVNTPGDSDSIASLAGALVGAKTGKVFVDKDLALLENYNELIQLAKQI
jgi:ADP-ribosylglycohydrolase